MKYTKILTKVPNLHKYKLIDLCHLYKKKIPR